MNRTRKRRLLWIAGSVVVVLAAVYVAGFIMTGLRMPANASIGAVDVSGLSPGDARKKLSAELKPEIDKPVVLTYDDNKYPVKPKEVGLALDARASVNKAGGGHSWNPTDMVGLFFGDQHTDVVNTVDQDKITKTVASIADSVDVEPIEPQITFPEAKPKARKPKDGHEVQQADAVKAIRSAYLNTDEPVALPVDDVAPEIGADGLKDAMKSIAKPAMSGPVTIKADGKQVKLPVAAYAPALTIKPVDGAMQARINADDLKEPLHSATSGFGKKAVDASFKIEGGKPVVVPGKPGMGLPPKEMAKKLLPAITENGKERSVKVKTKVVKPEFTTKDAKKLGIKEKVSEFSTYFPYAEYRNVNQSRAAELIDGTVLKPGETFSFNDTVGERTEARGFTSGTVINGGVFRDEMGGGVSQVATTTYNAAFFAGLTDVEHHPHAFYLDRYPVGREATIYFGNLDLRFKNPTDHGVLITASVRNSSPGNRGEMRVQMWSTKVWEIKASKSSRRNHRAPGTQYDSTNRCVPQSPIPGFDIDIHRKFLRGGKVVKRETDTAHYRAADHVICGEKPGKKKKKNN